MTDRSAAPALYREAFAASTDASLITDAAFRVVDATDACLDMLDRERETLLGDNPEPLFADPGVFATATERVSAGETWRQECELRTAGGEALRVEGSATPLSVDGEHRGAVFGFADLTERYNRQESLRVLNRVLRHNLRNDANVVLGHLQNAGDIATDDRVEESIDVARGRMERSLDRARTAREFSRHLTGDEEKTLYPVDLGGALEQAINKVDTAGATVRADVPSGLLVRADETLTAALRNVVENAVTHTGSNPTVSIDAATDEETATLRVADDGPGIPPERRDQVRERGGTAVRHGQGLGLFFVDRLLAAYGGDLRIADSELGGCLVAMEFDRASAEGMEFSEDW